MTNELKLYRKAEEFLNKIYPRLINFPKSEKYSLCSEIKECNYKLLTYIAKARFVKSKRLQYLQEAESYLEMLRVLTKLARNRKYLKYGGFKDLDEDLTEISKMLTGYIKSTLNK